MLEMFRKIWRFAGPERKNINKSIGVSFIFAIFKMMEMGAVYFMIKALVEGKGDLSPAILSVVLMVVSIADCTLTKYFAQLQQTHAGYFMSGFKRLSIGERLKLVPMGYFNDSSLGEITGVCTTVLENVEMNGAILLVSVLGGLVNAFVFMILILIFDFRIGLLVIATTILYLLITSLMENKARKVAPDRQKSESKMVETILEYVQGMSIVKSFNLSGKGDKNLQDALEYNKNSNLKIEKLFTPYVIVQSLVLQVGSVLIMLLGAKFYLEHSLSLTYALMTIIISFIVFNEISQAGSSLAVMRVISSCMDRADEVEDMPQLEEKGNVTNPKSHDIEFNHVAFSYDERPILKDVSFKVKDNTTTAIVGPSGSGKTTMCSLISRFWDVDKGSITIGGKDVKDYTLEGLMDQISIVFQRVYLFGDTIENNIKFGRPEATHEEVVEAARKACCNDFIEKLPEGYNTVIGEGGASLSGGEKQRISIARAILKDSPIIILDEATANVDPENEDRLQRAIEELTKNKTIIMIAHRLKTVRNADQILVLNDGNIVQSGTHESLAKVKGIYKDFIDARAESGKWKL